ncbi:MAG TPA: DUF192 domain-containing protein [Pseudobacteroides sp.]|uniref:DUF192 domain-containing protein n=1 Tax=Pseudobacteroides sp. TaxID=1968840 RepID=UPI002F931FC5
MKLINKSKGTIISSNLAVADSFIKRFSGLMAKRELPSGSGLLLTKCNSIHMCFMKFSLDIIFIDDSMKVVHLIKAIPPWRVSGIVRSAKSTIELPVGTIDVSSTEIGDLLDFEQTF